jgi:hypothetical protein
MNCKKTEIFIAVVGGSRCSSEEAHLAEEVGRELVKHEATVVCGGLGGVMEAVCKGAAAEGGTTIGILPGDSRYTANPYVSIPIVTGMGLTRNALVVKSAHAVIAIDGSYGTLSEIAYAFINGIPVIGLNTWALSRRGLESNPIILAQTPIEAVEKAIAAARNS